MKNKLEPLGKGSVTLKGRLGKALTLSIQNRLNKVDYDHLVEPFRLRNETDGRWRCEFWGKIVRSAIFSWRSIPDEQLLEKIKKAVAGLLATQTPDGCISSYPAELQTGDWDLWGRKYVLLGLIRYYQEIEPSEQVKAAIVRVVDHLATQVGPGKKRIVDCGRQSGLAASSLLEPVVLAYRLSGEKRLLDYAKWITTQGGSDVNNVFEATCAGTPPSSLGNGKAYEMTSCFEGLAELYRETGEQKLLDSVLSYYRAVRDHEIFITGAGGLKDKWGEFWDNGRFKQTQQDVGALGETCVTTTWVKFCGHVLRLTADPTVADELERAFYNGVLGAMRPDGSWWMHRNPTPLAGSAVKIPAGDQIPGYGEDCCLAQGPMALAMAPWLAFMQDADGVYVNLYEDAEAEFQTAGRERIRLCIEGDFPRSSKVKIIVCGGGEFALRLRIPSWSARTTVGWENGTEHPQPGTYCELRREWRDGDSIQIEFDLSLRVIEAYDGGAYVALLRGPVVLAQDSRLGPVNVPISAEALKGGLLSQKEFREDMHEVYAIGTQAVCDYASAGNLFAEGNCFCTWLPAAEK